MSASAYEALLAAVRQHTGFSPVADSEPTEEYLKRLVKAVSGLTKGTFDGMAEPAQEWFDAAATAMSEQMPVPLPEGFTRVGDVVALRPEHDAKPPAPRIRRPTGAAIPPRVPVPPPKPPEPAKALPEPQPEEPVTNTVARWIIADERLSVDDIATLLKDRKIEVRRATIRVMRSQTLSLLRLIRDAGWKKPQAA